MEVWYQRRHASHKSCLWQDHIVETWGCYLTSWTDDGLMSNDWMLNTKLMKDQCDDDRSTKDELSDDRWTMDRNLMDRRSRKSLIGDVAHPLKN